LARPGKVLEPGLRRQLVSEEDSEKALRRNCIESVADAGIGLLENNGETSVVKKPKV
jgi:uncharacterized membrane protein YcaP (DUF421 family)